MSTAQFSGNPRAEWLAEPGPDRGMRMIEAFSFIDRSGRCWEVPAGMEVDGATIPRTLWSSVGSPFTGNYRRAAILHDAAIRDPGVPRIDADGMFYEACVAGGCTVKQAQLLYAGVCIGSWISMARPEAHQLARQAADAARLPGEHSLLDLEIRAVYTLLANELAASGDDFDAVRAIVARRLSGTA
ncbi:DUF1353 domain-containing protein [Massilia soli]|uniref:DUF1353 domain-containing protein n=1 Tax=Massilia soli TaxID=2792854 RepID=A0ABS7SU51_9BURK|nr:DUF1353 domain-containing protein [Massilia soli]MBZ2209469.1 DUF1353 domain-containing protein [Massilia soli]